MLLYVYLMTLEARIEIGDQVAPIIMNCEEVKLSFRSTVSELVLAL